MGTSEDVAILEVEYSGVKTYSQTFRVPPPSTLFKNMTVVNKNGYHFRDLRFNSDLLAEIDHSWEFKILPDRLLEVEFRVKYYPDKGFILHPSKALLLAGDKLKAEADLYLREFEVGSSTSDYVWTCITPQQVLDGSKLRQDTCIPNEYIRKWDDSVDSIRIELQFQCESSGKCLNSEGWNPTGGLGGPSGKNLKSKDFFLNDFLSDVTLVCGSERFPAHRLILSCQSAVFQRMFQTEMKETKEGMVEIQDVNPNVLKEVLHFIYMDELSTTEIGDDLWLQLYKVVHKYEIQVLKLKCQHQILGSICPENAIQLLVFSDLYNDEGLKQKAFQIIKREKKKVMAEATTFLEFTNNYPHLAFELFNI